MMEWLSAACEAFSQFFFQYELYAKILISALLGFIIGFDRTHKSKPAGVKTYMFVTVASALLTIISIAGVVKFGGDLEQSRIVMDPMRLSAQIVTGLGFIGAGLILKDGLHVKGLTSAAMIFFAGGVGIGIGAGFYGIVIFTVCTTFLFSGLGNWVEKKENERLHQRQAQEALKQTSADTPAPLSPPSPPADQSN